MGEIKKNCWQCRGSGTRPASDVDGTPIPCGACSGTGKESWGAVNLLDISDKLDDLLNKCNDIFEKVSE